MTAFPVTPGLEHLLPAYFKELAQDTQTLCRLRDGNPLDLAHHAHGFGGKCAMMGDRGLADWLYELERQARAGQRERAVQMVDQFCDMAKDRGGNP